MKKKKEFRQHTDEDLFRGARKPAQKAPKNQKRKIFEEIEEEEDIEELFSHDQGEDYFDDQVEDDEDI